MDPAPLIFPDNQNDEPPPLEDMSDVLKKMHFNSDKVSCSSAFQEEPIQDTVESLEIPKKEFRRTEDKTSLVTLEPVEPMLITSKPSTNKSPAMEPSVPLKPLKRGFFDVQPKQAQSKSQLKSRSQEVKEEIPLIRPSKPQKDQQHKIPEFMRVEQDPSRIKLQQEVREMMKPTQELVKDVMETTDIKNGLEDPEIMAAVAEIAGNPDAMHKYKNDKKVVEFYNKLGKLMRSRIRKQDKAAQCQNARRTAPTDSKYIHSFFGGPDLLICSLVDLSSTSTWTHTPSRIHNLEDCHKNLFLVACQSA